MAIEFFSHDGVKIFDLDLLKSVRGQHKLSSLGKNGFAVGRVDVKVTGSYEVMEKGSSIRFLVPVHLYGMSLPMQS